MKSWKTTVGALIVLLSIVFHEVGNIMDTDPLTTFNWDAVIAGIGVFIMGLFARDKNVTSEQQSAK